MRVTVDGDDAGAEPRREVGVVPPSSAPLRTVAVVLAGGSGSRVGLDVPKQFLRVAGRPILEHTVRVLHGCAEVDEIVVVVAEPFLDAALRLLRAPDLGKVGAVLPGGANRNASTLQALESLGDQECNVLVHDAVRPLLSRTIVTDCVRALQRYEAVDVGIPSADTVVRVDADEHITDIPERRWLRRGQTPQAFRLSVLRRAYELAREDPGFVATDDCAVVLRYLPHVPIKMVAGDEQNMKVTYPVDLYIVDKLFQLRSGAAAPLGPDEHTARLRGRTVVVLGGTSGIGAHIAARAETAGCRVFPLSRSATGTDVEDAATVERALGDVATQTGAIDAVVLTAGVLVRGPVVDMEEDAVLRQLKVNYLGPVNVARAAHPYLRETKGHLLFFTSSSYTRGRAGYALYSSTKAAVVNLTQALADEWAVDGVHVNALNPERTRTPMRLDAFGLEPQDTLLTSDTVAATALDVLVSDLTGQVVDVRLSTPLASDRAYVADEPHAARDTDAGAAG